MPGGSNDDDIFLVHSDVFLFVLLCQSENTEVVYFVVLNDGISQGCLMNKAILT